MFRVSVFDVFVFGFFMWVEDPLQRNTQTHVKAIAALGAWAAHAAHVSAWAERWWRSARRGNGHV